MNVFVSTHPFGEASEAMFNEFNKHFDCVRLNPLGHKLSSEQLAAYISDADYLIAGTEKIT